MRRGNGTIGGKNPEHCVQEGASTKISTIAAVVAISIAGFGSAHAAEPIKIGDINSYSAMPGFTVPYRNGATLALEQINAAGGVLGRPLAFVSRDDEGRPDAALRAANELVFNV